MRVCDLTTLYIDGGEGGVNTYLTEKARQLAGRADVDHVVIVPGERDERRTLFDSTLYTLRARSLPSNPQHRVLTRFREVTRILRETDPDVVEVDCAYLLGQVAHKALSGRGVPVIGFYHVHLPTFIAKPRWSRFGTMVASTVERWAWRYVDYCNRYCDRVVVTSSDIRARLAQAGFTSPLEHVPLGVNLDLFRPGQRDARQDAPVEVLYVGRLSREKDVDVLLKAFDRLHPRGRFRLRLVGDGPVRADLERQARHDSRVSFLGTCPYGEGLADVYASADLLVVPSPNETFNLTVLEGLASGLPVVAVRQGGPRDLVVPEVGALASPGDPSDLARRIEEVAARAVDPAACRRHVAQNYSWERSVERLLAVYESAAVRGRVSTAS